MAGHVFTFEEAKQEFDYIIDKYEDFGAKERDELIKQDRLHRSDTNVLLKGGKDWLIEPLRELQPLSFAALREHASDYMVGFRWRRTSPQPNSPKDRLSHDGFFVVKGRVIWARYGYEGHSTPNIAEVIKQSWLDRSRGWGTTEDAVAVNPRQFISDPFANWTPVSHFAVLLDESWEKTILPSLLEKIPNLYVTRMVPGEGDGYYEDRWVSFRCFLDSRLPEDYSFIGDQLYVVDSNPDGRIYWIKDFDFKTVYYLNNPGEAIDAYSAHTLLQTPGRFDFSPWAVKL